MASWVEGRVVGLQQWTDRLYSLRMEAEIPPFRAGQFTRLALEIDGETVARPYSFVNPPDDPLLEFYFIRVPGGPLTARLVALRPGDPLLIAPRSAGFFVLEEVPAADTLWMLSTGTALGPFLSILRTPQPWQQFGKIVLVHAVRHLPELTYRETIDSVLEAHAAQLQYIPFVSREVTDFTIHGRVTAAIENGVLEDRAGLALSAANSQVMICGNPGMVADTRQALEARGMKKNRRSEPGQITTEQYWNT
jgi:ferredoxin--NADP+ reductase